MEDETTRQALLLSSLSGLNYFGPFRYQQETIFELFIFMTAQQIMLQIYTNTHTHTKHKKVDLLPILGRDSWHKGSPVISIEGE
jgi:hypothetical protein